MDSLTQRFEFTGVPKQRLLGWFKRHFVSHETGFRPENGGHY